MVQPRSPSPPRSIRALVFFATLVIALLWVAVTHPYEGPVIYEISGNHGIHRYDSMAFIPPLAALLWWMSAF